jgi:hypothetical protein
MNKLATPTKLETDLRSIEFRVKRRPLFNELVSIDSNVDAFQLNLSLSSRTINFNDLLYKAVLLAKKLDERDRHVACPMQSFVYIF